MFCTFTTEHGTLIIRTEDVRRIEDSVRYDLKEKVNVPVCVVEWTPNGTERCFQTVHGTAAENLARLKAEELAAIEAAQRLQQRQGDGLPLMPVPRGRAR